VVQEINHARKATEIIPIKSMATAETAAETDQIMKVMTPSIKVAKNDSPSSSAIRAGLT